MAFDFSNISDEELEAMAAQSAPASEPMPQKPLSEWTDEELEAYASEPTPAPAQSAAHSPRMTREERIAANNRAIETARSQEEPGFLSAAGEAIAEGAKGAARAVKSIGSGIVGMASGAVRLAGTPVRLATGWEGLHRLADTIDSSYENFGADALMSDYGENPDGFGFAAGRFGEKLAATAGSLAAIGGPGLIAKAGKLPGAVRATGAAVQKVLPFMFGNDAAVRAYDTARANGRSKTEAAALAGLNGAIHFIGFKLFENKSLNKMLGMPQEMEVMMPKWADKAAEAGGQSFSSLARGVRNGMIKYTLAERGKGALKAGGIMGLQNFLSDPVMQVAEGADIDDIDFSRMLKAGAEGVGEGALMEGALGAAAVLKSPAEARKFIADKYFRGKDYKVMGADGKMHDEPGLLNSPEGRMFLMKQNPAATERVLDIVEHGGTPRPAELDAAFLPPDMTAEELKKFASDWRNDLKPYVDEAWAADAPRQTAAPDAASAEPGRDMLSPEEAQSQQKAANDAAERQKLADRRAAADSMMLDFESWNRLYADGKTDLNFDEWRAAGKPGVIEANLTPKTEEAPTSETRANEEPAQPEQAEVVAPPARAEARPVESAEAAAEAADARVVEIPVKPAEAAQKPVEAAAEPKVGENTPAPAKPAEAASRVSGAENISPNLTEKLAEAAKPVTESPKTDASATVPAESGTAAPVVENRGDAATVAAPESVEAKIAAMKRGSPEQLKAQREYVEREVAKAKDAIKGKFRPKTGRLSPREKAVDAYERIKNTGDIPETVNIKVPGDGEITVKNNPNGMAFLDRFAAKFRPHPTSGESAMALPRSSSIKVSDKPKAESAEKEFAPFVSKDKTRERILKPYTEGKMVVATDGRVAVRRPLRRGESVKGADDAPRASQVFGRAEDAATESAAIDVQAIFPKLQQALVLEGSVFMESYEPETGKPTGLNPRATSHAVELWRDADGALQVRSRDTDGNSYASDAWSGDSAPVAALDGKVLVEIVRLAAKNGEGKIEVRFAKDAQDNPVLFKFGGYEAALMPLRAKGHFDEARRVDSESARANPAERIPDGKDKMVNPKAAESDYGVTMFEEPAVDGEGVSYVVKDGPSDAHRMMFKSKSEAEARLAELRAERKAIKESPSATLAEGKKIRLVKTDEGWVPYDENYNDLRHGMFKAAETKAGAIKVAEKGVKWARDVAEENARLKAESAKSKPDGKGKMVKPEPKSAEGAGAEPPSVPAEPSAKPKSNRLRRADGTDPLAEKPMPKTLQKAVYKISSAIANRTGTGVITPDEAYGIVKGIAESPGTKHNRTRDFFGPLEKDAAWHESMGLDAESAKNIRDAFDRVKADADLKKWFPQVDSAVKKAKDGKLSRADAVPLFGKISEGLEKAERMGLSEAANRLHEAAEVIRPVAEEVTQGDVGKFNYSTKGRKLNNRLGGTDKRGGKTVSLDTKNGTVDVGADGRTLDDVIDEGADASHDRRSLKPGESYGKGFTGDEVDAGGEPIESNSANKGDNGILRDTDKNLGRRGIQLETKNGVKSVVWRNDMGDVVRRAPLDMLEKAAAKDPGIKDLIERLKQGEQILASKSAESPAERDLRFASDENYQKWLKSRKANDAEPLRERYEQEQAKAAKSIARNTLPGVDVEIVDRAFNPETDGGNRQLLDGEGRVVGTFDRSTNKVKLYRGASATTLVHELGGHATLRFAEQEAERGNRQLLDRINRAIDEAPQALKDEIRSRYPRVDETALRDEIWATLRERNSPAMEKVIKTLQGKAWYNRAWSAFRDAWKGLLARMGFNRADLSQIDRMSNDEFLSHLDRIMSDGKTLGRLEATGEGPAPADTSAGSPTVREARSPRPAGSRIMDDQQTKGEKFTEKYIDSRAPVKSVQEELGGVKEITRADGYTDHTKSTDLVAAKDKANGRLEHEMRQHQFRIDDINRDLARAALPKQSTEELVNDFNLYLQCKHAPERNLSVAQDRGDAYTPDYSEGMGQITLPGKNKIGLSENVANRLLKGMRGKYGLKFKMFENAADKVYKMLEADLDRRFDAGRLSAEDYAFYKTRWHGPGGADGKWAHYVPLKTDMERLEPEALNSSTAGMKRNEFMKAQGRGTGDIADSPLAAAVLQTEQGIRGSIKNEVANVEANLVEHAQKQGIPIAEIVPGDEIRRGRTYSFTFDDGETVDASGSMRLVENRPEIHLFKRDGKLYAIRYKKGANGRGLAFAKAASGENMGRWGQGLEWIPHMTHLMSAMRTQYSPEFTVSNWLADHLEAAQALVGRYGLKEGGKAFAKTVASEIQNWKDLRAYLKDGTANGYIKEFVEGGGLTKGGVASEGFEAETQKIRSKIEQFRREQKQWREMSPADLIKSLGRNVTDLLSFANELAEYSTRTGLYTALRKQGVPQAEAIKFARDATVNFNRKGTAMPYINGLYMFANASVQGAVRSVQAMRDTHGKELVAALTAIGVAKAVIDNYLGNDDEREAAGGRNARNQSEYDKKHNVGVPIGGGRQIVPLRFRGPYAAVPYLAQTAANVAMGVTSPEDGAKTLVRELGDQVTDIVGGNGIMNDRGELDGSLIGQSIAPSVADPIVQLATGKDYKGDERRRKSFDKTMPASSNGKRNTGDWYKVAAQTLNRMSGGNEHRKGLVDVAPEDLQLVLEFLGGAPMRDINNVASSVNNAVQLASGGTPERTLSQIPFVRRVVREYPESTSRYYDALENYERDKAEFKKTTPERRREMKADKPYLFTGKSLLDGQIERIKELTHLERGEVKVGQKWVEPKTPRTEEQKEKYRKLRLEMQARVLKRLGE